MVSPYHNGGVEDYQVNYGGLPGRMAEATERAWRRFPLVLLAAATAGAADGRPEHAASLCRGE